MKPKKSLGQHWLFDEQSLGAMMQAGDISSNDIVLEVGPGLGTLTNKLIKVAKQVIAVELDQNLIAKLKDISSSNLVIVNEDILIFDLSGLPKNYKVIANIPYYLTSNLIRRFLEFNNKPAVMALLVQKEVAQRIVAEPGQHSLLSVSVQFYAKAELKDIVPAKLFTPPPKVDSQIIKITPYSKPLFNVDEKQFFKIIKAGFSEKRKKLRSSLSGGLSLSKQQVDDWLKEAKINPDSRAQELEIKDWYNLSKLDII